MRCPSRGTGFGATPQASNGNTKRENREREKVPVVLQRNFRGGTAGLLLGPILEAQKSTFRHVSEQKKSCMIENAIKSVKLPPSKSRRLKRKREKKATE